MNRLKVETESTDSPEIQAIAVEFGGTVPFTRPSELATDEAPEWLSWQHALNFLFETEGAMPTRMISVPTTSPLRLSNDISSCIKLYDESAFDAIITGTEARRSPYFNMVRANPFGEVELLLRTDLSPVRRQDTTQAYDLTTVCYVVNSNFVMRSAGIFDGRVGIYSVPQERAVDIDTELDFQIADFLLRGRLSSGPKF